MRSIAPCAAPGVRGMFGAERAEPTTNMNRLLVTALVAAGLASSAPALTTVGLETGYLTDWKEAYISGHLGYEFQKGPALSHQAEIEIGYTEKSDSVAVPGGVVTAKGKIVPLMLNYRGEYTASEKLGYYYGLGLGTARVSVSGSGLGVSVSDSDNAMCYQFFLGVIYRPSVTTSVQLGLKYLWIDDINILGMDAEVGDDLGLCAGVSFKF